MRWKFWERKQVTSPEVSESLQTKAPEAPAEEASTEIEEVSAEVEEFSAEVEEFSAEVPEEELAEVVIGEPQEGADAPKQGFLRFLKERLTKTRQGFLQKIDRLLMGRRSIGPDLFDELEEVLISGDLGVQTTTRILQDLQKAVKEHRLRDPLDIKAHLRESLLEILNTGSGGLCEQVSTPPLVILMVGVNGVGKTTTIAKLAYQLKHQGKKVLLAAGDTFRAAGIEQLQVWGDRVGVEVIKHGPGADPAAVVFDTIHAAQARRVDVVIVDTAGRLHTQVNLMEECKKIRRVIAREHAGAPHEVLLVLDATIGQNAIAQARQFHDALGLTGLVMTKLDGTAKGGVLLGIISELKIPVKLIGVGEKLPDLQPFDPPTFAAALFED
ncbi:MAG: signal recognition particle-docking protein FtsY [Candidatus Entotheonellia bacterium]